MKHKMRYFGMLKHNMPLENSGIYFMMQIIVFFQIFMHIINKFCKNPIYFKTKKKIRNFTYFLQLINGLFHKINK